MTDRQLSKSILLQAQTSECKSVHLPHEAFRTWEPSHAFWHPFFFTDEACLLQLSKIKISEYHQELKSADHVTSSRKWKLKPANQVHCHINQQILAGKTCQKLFDLYHKQFGCWVASCGLYFLIYLEWYQYLSNQSRLDRGAFRQDALSLSFLYLSCLLFWFWLSENRIDKWRKDFHVHP